MKQAAAAYLRWAQENQEGARDRGWEKIEAAADAAGLEIVGWYLDPGVSGLTPLEERSGGAALLKAAASAEFAVVLTPSLDRIGRKASVVNTAVNQLAAAGVKLETVREGGAR